MDDKLPVIWVLFLVLPHSTNGNPRPKLRFQRIPGPLTPTKMLGALLGMDQACIFIWGTATAGAHQVSEIADDIRYAAKDDRILVAYPRENPLNVSRTLADSLYDALYELSRYTNWERNFLYLKQAVDAEHPFTVIANKRKRQWT